MTTLQASTAAATAAYYATYLVAAPGEVPGRWTGRQAALLGLDGAVDASSLQALLEGHDPITGSKLGRSLVDRVTSNGNVIHAVSGFDATFSAPKSLSVLWALTGDERLLAAHDTAVTATLGYLERYGATTRVRSNGGRLHLDTLGLTMATFRQTTSRADDPQIHTHAVIFAKVQTGDGRWMALDARFLKRHQRTLGGLYQSVLRNELSHRLGVTWGDITNGQAELAGAPPELLMAFSKRTSTIDRDLDARVEVFRREQGRDPTRRERAALTRAAAANTRSAKSGDGTPDLGDRWRREAADTGWTAERFGDSIQAAARAHGPAGDVDIRLGDVIDALSVNGSAWSQPDIMRVLCDTRRPVTALDGTEWAAALDDACGQAVDLCVELDPTDTATRRESDGRSVWLEPISAHLTSHTVLAEEERVLDWAAGAQAGSSCPSPTVDTDGLDVLQAHAAAAVAGHDRLVLVVGPAGAGKTSALRSAVADLTRRQRRVLGLAPSAKAARVLATETGVESDTVAKLLHEWARTDRPPDPRFLLRRGDTVLVDEAGMIGTNALARLVDLIGIFECRLVLVGDHRQLQAVGRGGLFEELCLTGHSHELQRIHRFSNAWEAAASFRLRHGDPSALDAYETNGRIIADTFDGHLQTISQRWIDTTASGDTIAITASTNDHVDAINAAIQHARVAAGHLDPNSAVAIAGGETAHAGDVVATRRNDRTITDSSRDHVRNRQLWTVIATHPDGTLTAQRLGGGATVHLPVEYVRDHVRLGYAATEHGHQGDTVTVGLQLVSSATTRRGLYVGATRGRSENTMHVVTDPDGYEIARDTLERVIAVDRADVPAVSQQRTLHAAAPSHAVAGLEVGM